MADAAASLVEPCAGAVADAAKQRIIAQHEGHYNLEEVKAWVLSILEQIKEDTTALRTADFKTACQALRSWHESLDDAGSAVNLERLRRVADKAGSAFNLVPDPIHKIRAASMVIISEYYCAALTSSTRQSEGGEPDWAVGKQEAQQLLRQYVNDLPELTSAAEEELKKRSYFTRVYKDTDKRRAVLREFAKLSSAVLVLRPKEGNRSHPRFGQLEQAAHQVFCKDNDDSMWQVSVSPIISEPLQRRSRKVHHKTVDCCSGSEDGRMLVSGSEDHTLKVWDVSSGRDICTLQGHTGWVYCCCLFAGDTQLVSGGADKTLRIWDLATGKEVRTLEGHTESVSCCQVFESNTRLVSGSWDKTLKVWDLSTGETLLSLKGHDSVYCCQVFTDNTLLVSGSSDGTLKIWNMSTGRAVLTIEGHAKGVSCCSLFDDDKYLVSGSYDCTLRVWEVATGREIHALQGHTDPVKCCSVFGSDALVVSGSADESLKIWDLSTGEDLCTLRASKDDLYLYNLHMGITGMIECCSVIAMDTCLVSGGRDRALNFWDLPLSLLQRTRGRSMLRE